MKHFPLVALLASAALACGGDAATDDHSDVVADTALLSADAVRIGGFTLAAASEEPWGESWRLPGRLTMDPNAQQPLGSLVEGRIIDVTVLPGDRVHEGQVLVAIHSHEVMSARQELAAARAGVTTADSAAAVAVNAAARGERLYAAKAIALGELERLRAARVAAEGARDAAHAELERADGFLEHLVGTGARREDYEHAALLRAPFDGIITGRDVQPGQVVLVGQPLVTIARDAGLGVLMHLPEEGAASVRAGAVVRLTVPALGAKVLDARVARVAPVVDSLSRAIHVWARIESASALGLRAEMSADAEIIASGGARTLSVPAAAVQVFEGDTVVIRATRLGEGMLLEAAPVRVGRQNTLRAEILAGLAAGDSVLNQGAAVGKGEIVKRRSGGDGGH